MEVDQRKLNLRINWINTLKTLKTMTPKLQWDRGNTPPRIQGSQGYNYWDTPLFSESFLHHHHHPPSTLHAVFSSTLPGWIRTHSVERFMSWSERCLVVPQLLGGTVSMEVAWCGRPCQSLLLSPRLNKHSFHAVCEAPQACWNPAFLHNYANVTDGGMVEYLISFHSAQRGPVLSVESHALGLAQRI